MKHWSGRLLALVAFQFGMFLLLVALGVYFREPLIAAGSLYVVPFLLINAYCAVWDRNDEIRHIRLMRELRR